MKESWAGRGKGGQMEERRASGGRGEEVEKQMEEVGR